MQIPAEYLNELNYEGTRLIEIKDERVKVLQEEIDKCQKEANPFLEKMEALTPEMDRVYAQIRELEEKKNALLRELQPTKDKYDVELKEVQKIDEKAQVFKDKLTPIIMSEIASELNEFEFPLHTKIVDGKMFVEVRDELEEKVKQLRTQKTKYNKEYKDVATV